MRVLLISTNREMLPDPVAPLGAAMVAAALNDAGHDVRLLDLQFVPDIVISVKDACRNFKPKVVGVSIRNIDNVAFPKSVSYLPDIDAVFKAVRASGVRLIVPGGSGFTLMPRQLMERLDLNLGIVGEGEAAFPRLLKCIEEKLPVAGIPGLAYRHNGKITINASEPRTRLESFSPPERSLIDNAAYMREGGAGNIQTKRGCSYKCCYCTYPIVEGRKVRIRPPADAADEMVSASARLGIGHFFVVDNVFNNPVGHAKSFCRELIKRGSPVGWSCYLSPVGVDEELIRLMRDAGCNGAEFGTDSADKDVLAALGKGFGPDDIMRASRICREAGLRFCHGLMLGAPGETVDSVKRTLEFMDKAQPNAVIAMLGIRVFPGTRLEAIAREEGVITSPIGLDPVFYFSKGLDIEKVVAVLQEHGRTHANFIMPGIHLRMTNRIRKTLRGHGLVGPLWEYLKSDGAK